MKYVEPSEFAGPFSSRPTEYTAFSVMEYCVLVERSKSESMRDGSLHAACRFSGPQWPPQETLLGLIIHSTAFFLPQPVVPEPPLRS